MITEPTTADCETEAREMIAAWTRSLLRQRTRPAQVPPRGGRQYAAAAARPETAATRFVPTTRAA